MGTLAENEKKLKSTLRRIKKVGVVKNFINGKLVQATLLKLQKRLFRPGRR